MASQNELRQADGSAVDAALVVIAKAPVPGSAKTRLCPPCHPAQAAALARAALADTLAAVLAAPVRRRLLVLDGPRGSWLPAGIEVLAQRGEGLAERLANAFADVGESALVIGMDTPQVTARQLERGLATLLAPGVDAVLGPATDGGYWAIGLRRPDARVFDRVPMSSPDTGDTQWRRLEELGLRARELGPLRDVDRFADVLAVAAAAPHGRFARIAAGLAAEFTEQAA